MSTKKLDAAIDALYSMINLNEGIEKNDLKDNQEVWQNYLKQYGKVLNLPLYELEKKSSSGRSHEIFSHRRSVIRRVASQVPLFSDKVARLVLSNNYFKHPEIVPALSPQIFNELWEKDTYWAKGLTGFYKVVKQGDVNKFKTFYSEGKDCTILRYTDSDISAHRNIDVFREALIFAIKQQDLELMKKVYESESFFMYDNKSNVVIEAFCAASEYVNSDLLAKMRLFMRELKGTSNFYKKALDKGHSKILNNSPTLMFKMETFVRRNLFNRRYHYSKRMPSKEFILYMKGELSEKDLPIHGDRDLYNYPKSMLECKKQLIAFWKSLNNQGKFLIRQFEDMTRYMDDRFVSEYTPYPYFTMMMLNRPEKVTANLVQEFFEKMPEEESFMKDLKDRLVAVDNVLALKACHEIKRPEEDSLRSLAQIAALYGSEKVLEYLGTLIGKDANWKNLTNSMKS